MTMRLIVRGYLGRQVQFEHPLTVDSSDMKNVVERESMANVDAMAAGTIDMVELEFPEFPPRDRYFRIGLNPDGMVMPIEMDL